MKKLISMSFLGFVLIFNFFVSSGQVTVLTTNDFTTFPGTGWSVSCSGTNCYQPVGINPYSNCSSYPNNNKCSYFDTYFAANSSIGNLISPSFSLSNLSSATLSIKLINNGSNGGFKIYLSTNGGTTFPYTIATNPINNTSSFVTLTYNLSAYVGQSNCVLKFSATSDYGSSKCNCVYLDDVGVTGVSACTLPTVSSTTSAASITACSASSGGNISADGGCSITERGICFATSQNPTIANTKVTSSGTTGTFTINLSNLSPNTTYYVRAYATNNNGTSYGTQTSFTTSSLSIAFSNSPFIFCQNIAISNQTPTTSGSPTSFSISPSLPTGLTINGTSGLISGTPTSTSSSTTYTISSSNLNGCSTNTTINISVNSTPTLVNAGADATICSGTSTPLTGSAIGSIIYTQGTLYTTDFSGTVNWQTNNVDKWFTFTNNHSAGGTAPEIGFQSSGSSASIDAYVVSQYINAANWINLKVSFKHFVDQYTSTAGPLTLESSVDGITWTSRWSLSPTSDVTATTVSNIDLSAMNGQNFKLRFRHNGIERNINNWFIDDVIITGSQGSNSAITYAWTSSPSGFNSSVQNPGAVSPTSTTTYTLTATSNGCSVSDDKIVTVNNTPTVATPSTPSAVCAGVIYNPSTPSMTANGSSITAQGWQIETAVGSNLFSSLIVPYTLLSADNGKKVRYYASNGCGTSYSSTVSLAVNASVLASVSMSSSDTDNSFCLGTSVTFTATPTNGGTTPIYQWKVNGVNTGSNSNTFTTSSLSNTDLVSVLMTSNANCVTGSPATSNSIANTINTPVVPYSILGKEYYIWSGSNSSSFNSASNWYYKSLNDVWSIASSLPTTNKSIIVGTGNCILNNPIVTSNISSGIDSLILLNGSSLTISGANSRLTVQNDLVLKSGATLTLDSNRPTLEVQGGSLKFEGTSTFNPGNGTVEMHYKSGHSDAHIISCSSNSNNVFYNLNFHGDQIEAGDTAVALASDITVNGLIQVVTANFNLGNHTLTLGSNASLVEGINGKKVFDFGDGKIVTTRNVGNGGTSDFGGLGLTITLPDGKSMGSTTIERYHRSNLLSVDAAGLDGLGNAPIERFFRVTPTTNGTTASPLNATLTFDFNTADLGNYSSNDEATFAMYRKGSGETSWQQLIGSVNSSANTLTVNNFPKFSDVTLGGGAQPLPVELISFNGICSDKTIELNWRTASEHNSAYFDVEKSRDGEHWQVVTTIQAAGTSNELLSYYWSDVNSNDVVTNYFRLRQVDIDGKQSYYGPIKVTCSEKEEEIFYTYPNPTENSFQIICVNEELIGLGNLSLINSFGAIVHQSEIEVKSGINMFVYNEKLAPGIYFISIQNGNKTTSTIKHVVK